MQNNQLIGQNVFSKGLNMDLNTSLVREDLVTYARNAKLFSKEGDTLIYQSENGQEKVLDLPYECIGDIELPDGTYALFLTDNVNNEIGIFDPVSKTYKKKINNKWLNLNKANLVTGASKENSDGSFTIYFSDGRRNPDRVINLSKVDKLTFDNIRLSRLITPPTLSIKEDVNGLLKNGSYQAAIFYSANSVKFGNAYSLTLPTPVFTTTEMNGAITVSIDNLDNDFEEFQLVLIQSSKGATTAKIVGTYPSKTKSVTISNFDRPEYITLPLEELVLDNEIWVASDQINANNQHLFRVGVESVPDPNYQLQALSIDSEYVVMQAKEDYYKRGNNVGYYRDESYLYYIQLLHKVGKYSSAFVLKNRDVQAKDRFVARGMDVYENQISTEKKILENWQVNNTAGLMKPVTHTILPTSEMWEIGTGEMAYFESTETYPDNRIQFGEYANKPIQLFKYPDESKVSRYSKIDGKTYINILGIRFKNIPAPLKQDGTIDEDWVGYRIIRASRDGNRTIISRGLLSNVRSYKEEDREILYPNYPFNDLREDTLLSSTQTAIKNDRETNIHTLKDFKEDIFTYYSPHTSIGKYSLGEEIKVESEEIADVKGEFREVYKHPKFKLLSNFGYWVCVITGIVEAAVVASGMKFAEFTTKLQKDASITGGVRSDSESKNKSVKALDIITGGAISSIKAALAGDVKGVAQIALIMSFIASAGVAAALFTVEALEFATATLALMYRYFNARQFAIQHNNYAKFDDFATSVEGSRRRYVMDYKYLQDGLQEFEQFTVNNYKREGSVILRLNSKLLKPKIEDTSRNTISNFQAQDSRKNTSKASMYYVTSKRNIPNPYGRVESNFNFVLTHSNTLSFGADSPVIFGGDCWITRFTQMKTFKLFTQDLANTDFPDGVGFDYKLYRNVAYPRFWVDSFEFDFSSLLSKKVISRTSFSRTTSSKQALDAKNDSKDSFSINSGYFYTSVNGVIDFIVESDYNLHFRTGDNFFEKSKDINAIFRSDNIDKLEDFKYDTSMSKEANQIFATPQPTYYDPNVFNTVYKYNKNRISYSLPSYKEQLFDNWRYFLSLNSHEFPRSEFGNFISLHRVDGDRLMFLFDRSSPYITVGRQQLEVSGKTVTIGDGGIFAQQPRELSYTEQHYGNSQSRMGAITTHFGTFYVSERQGRFMKFSNNLDEVSRNGIFYWSKAFFPIQLVEHFPEFKHLDNPVIGCGYQVYFNNIEELIYITKKDYIPKFKEIVYDPKVDRFRYSDITISLQDKDYFEEVSFTLSYSPIYNAFVSFHDYFPDWIISTEKSLFMFKGKSVWKHSVDKIYSEFFGEKKPFEIEFVHSNKMQVQTISNLEYYLECLRYRDDEVNQYHLKDENFDNLIMYNTEQCSGICKMIKSVNPYQELEYPKFNGKEMEVLFSKTENKYRVSQFSDLVKDRDNPTHIMFTLPNGWQRLPNPVAIDYRKDSKQRKLFRHYDTRILLQKESPSSLMILKLNLTKGIISPR